MPTPRALALLEEVELSYVGLERIAATALSLRQSPQGGDQFGSSGFFNVDAATHKHDIGGPDIV